jgi:hypothetical protein
MKGWRTGKGMHSSHDVIDTRIILPVAMPLRLMLVTAILCGLMMIWPQDKYVFAQTSGNEPVETKDEGSDHPQAATNEGIFGTDENAKHKPEPVDKPSESTGGSWGSAIGLGGKIDWMHSNLFNLAQSQVERVDNWFRSQQDQVAIEQSRFRLGLFGDAINKGSNRFRLKSEINLDANIDLPNVVRHLKLIVTTNDPTALPGKDINNQQEKTLRTALSKQWMSNISTAVGVRARWKTPLFAYISWSPAWKKEEWHLYPQEKLFWQNRDGFGEISTLMLDHWVNRWNMRISTSVKWTKQNLDLDRDNLRHDDGFRWSEVFIFDHANELLDETQLGRIVSGDDIMRGWGVKLAAFGGFHFTDEYQAGLFYRFPLWKKWMYFLIQPEVDWKHADNWKPRWTIRFGLDMLFWGGKER